MPAITFLATANAVRMTGAEVVFADVDPDTGLLTPDTLRAALARAEIAGARPRAALPVHLNGQVCDMDGLAAVAEGAGISLIEDACHALGTSDVGAARHSKMACFSTHPVKAIATGEGGIVTTADASLAGRLRKLRSHGMTRDADEFEMRDLAFDGDAVNPWHYEMHEFGWNYRIPDLLCALGLSQLQKLERFYRRRQEIAALYDRLLAPLAPAIRPVPHGNAPHGWHLYAVLIDFDGIGITRRRVMEALRADGIGTQVHYTPVNRQPYYRRHAGDAALPGADAYYARCLSLPLFPGDGRCRCRSRCHGVAGDRAATNNGMTSLAVFRCDAGPAIGGGHVMRCLTLADALAARGWTCRFAVGPMTADLVPDVVRYAPISVPDSPDREAGTIAASIGACDLLIVDHYGRDAVFEKASRSFARSILTIDDLADRAHDCDILVDQTLGRREADYRSIVPERCRLLLGTAYALLRPQFCAAREHALRRRHESEPARRVLISFGASNSNGLAATAISSLCAPGSALMLDVVTGAHVPA